MIGFDAILENMLSTISFYFFPLNESCFVRQIREPDTEASFKDNKEGKPAEPSRALPCPRLPKPFEMQDSGPRASAGFISTLKGDIPALTQDVKLHAFFTLAGKKILVGFTHINISSPPDETGALDLSNCIDNVIF